MVIVFVPMEESTKTVFSGTEFARLQIHDDAKPPLVPTNASLLRCWLRCSCTTFERCAINFTSLAETFRQTNEMRVRFAAFGV